MRYHDLLVETAEPFYLSLSQDEIAAYLKFIDDWLRGAFMYQRKSDPLPRWRQLAEWFPPKVAAQVRLYRLLTLPIAYADRTSFRLPSSSSRPVSSWSSTLDGIDAVATTAGERWNSYDPTDYEVSMRAKTARVVIEAMIPGEAILANYQTIPSSP